MCRAILECGLEGGSVTAMANSIGVTRSTMYEWAASNPEFSDALDLAKQHSLEWFEEMGQRQARTGQGSAGTLKFLMTNQHREVYRDSSHVEVDQRVQVMELNYTGFDGDQDAQDADYEEID